MLGPFFMFNKIVAKLLNCKKFRGGDMKQKSQSNNH